ncbi:MAG: DUF554 domain-containing protein [Clostridia bacterium]|nr:DUF554 domain-containing protein [Clostridia bacterium]
MPGLGTVVNVVAVILGGIVGILFGKKIKETLRASLMRVLGIAVLFVGMAGAFSGMLRINAGKIETYGTMMMIISLVVGTLIGELIRIEDRLETFGEFLKRKINAKNDQGFVSAFVNTSLVICVGAMAVVGSIEDGLKGEHTTLFAKALLDFLIVIVMSSTLGLGSLFSFIPIGIFQGSITLLARFAEPLFSYGNIITDMSLVGNIMIACVGINLCFGKTIRVGNMLPSLIIAIIYSAITTFLN